MADKVISVLLKAQTGEYKRDMAAAARSTTDFDRAAQPATRSTASFMDTVAKAGAYAYGAKKAFDATVGAAISWESAFAGVSKTIDGTPAQLEAISEGLREMSKEIPTSAEELAGIAASAGQLGIQTPNVLGFTRVIADLGETTNMSGEQAATQLARLANITGMAQSDFGRLGSTVVALGNNLATTESEIVDMGLRLAGAGRQVGMTEAEILSLSGALSSVGIEAEAGGSAISKVMIDIASEVENGGESLELFARTAGMTAQEFSQAWRDDAAGALVTFITGLGNTEAKGQSTLQILEELGIEEVRMRDALLRTSSASDVLNRSLDIGESAWADNTALTAEAAQRYDTTAAKIDTAMNSLKDLGREIGEGTAPAVGGLADALNDALGAAIALGDVEINVTDIIATPFDMLSGLDEVFEGIGEGVMNFGRTLAGVPRPAREATETVDELATATEDVTDAANDSTAANDDLTGSLGALDATTADATSSLDDLADTLRAQSDPMFAALRSWQALTDVQTDAEASAADVAEQALRTQSDLMKLAEAVDNGTTSVAQVREQFEALEDQGMIPPGTADTVAGELAMIVGKADDTARGVTQALDLEDEFYGFGSAAGMGFVSGMDSTIAAAARKAAEMAEAATTSAQRSLQIRSPSRVFYELAEQTVRGYPVLLSDDPDTAIDDLLTTGPATVAA